VVSSEAKAALKGRCWRIETELMQRLWPVIVPTLFPESNMTARPKTLEIKSAFVGKMRINKPTLLDRYQQQ
jgi:hypothetical protein